MKKIIILVLAVAIFIPSIALAHPGRTDKRGCHTCWTKCAKWGLKYGQYHCHRAK